MHNPSNIISSRITPEERPKWHFIIDAVYKADPSRQGVDGEVLSKMLHVPNQRGFRRCTGSTTDDPKYIALFTSGEDVYWRDELDTSLGIFLYYGDQKVPGRDLEDTQFKGNYILSRIFEYACSEDEITRKRIPPVFLFKKAGGRDIQFLGLAVPGIQGKPQKEWLTAVWGSNKDGKRFLNYKAFFTVLNTASGCEAEKGESGISHAWLTDIEDGHAYDSKYAPYEWIKYIDNKKIKSLTAFKETYVKSKEEQLPDANAEQEKTAMLQYIHDFFIERDRGYSFESFASYIVEQLDKNVVRIDVTRPFKDGGIDAVGLYKIFSKAPQEVTVDFYMQAKCYDPYTNAVNVKDTSRLISRIKDRQFGIMVTTSYINKQAYQEILDDGHPIVLVTGKTIMDLVFDKFEVRTLSHLKQWLSREFSD